MAYGDTPPTSTGQRPQPTTGTKRNRYADSFMRRGKRYYRGASGKPILLSAPKATKPSGTTTPTGGGKSASRYSQLAKDPRTRRDVPDKYLTPEQLRQRNLNKRLSEIIAEGSNMTARDLAREANADTALRYGQAEGELGRQLKESQLAEARLPTFMDAYRKALADAEVSTSAAYQRAAEGAQGVGNADAVQSSEELSQRLAAAQAEATQRGGSVDPEMLKRNVDAAATRQANAGTVRDLARTQGANQSGYYGALMGNIPLKLAEQVGQERTRRGDVQGKIRDLLLEKGEFNRSQRAKITDRERSAGLERMVLGANVAEAQGKLAQDQADAAAASDDKRQEFIAKYGVSPERWRRMSPEQRRQWKAKWEKAGKTPPKGSTKDNYGYDQDEWDRMSPEERRKAKALWDKAGKSGPSSKTGSPRAEPESSLKVRRAIASRVGFVQKYANDRGLDINDRQQRAQLVQSLRKTHKGLFDNGGIQEKSLSAAIDLATDRGKISLPNVRWLRDQFGVYITTDGGYWGGGNRGSR